MSAPEFEEDSVKQTIELDEIFGIDFSDKRELREYIGQLIIDRIKARTESGIGMKFSGGTGREINLSSIPYSESYIKSDAFRGFGKSKSKVNLTLTGDMLGLLDIVDQDDNSITIGWDDDEQNPKAYNHSVGDTVPARPFFGVNKKELNEIKKEIMPELREAIELKNSKGEEAFTSFALSLIDELGE